MLIINPIIEPSEADEDTKEKLLRLVPTYETLAATSKIYFIQSLVSRLLIENIFQPCFVGLSKEHADELSRVEKYLSSFSK